MQHGMVARLTSAVQMLYFSWTVSQVNCIDVLLDMDSFVVSQQTKTTIILFADQTSCGL